MDFSKARRMDIPKDYRDGIKIPLYRSENSPTLDIPREASYLKMSQSDRAVRLAYFNSSNEDDPISTQTIRGNPEYIVLSIENML